MRVLITDESSHSLEARNVLEAQKIDFTEVSVEKISFSSGAMPVLLAPEGRFEGIASVSMYVRAEMNGVHKK